MSNLDANGNEYPPSFLIGAKRVREEADDGKGRRKVVVTFGPDSRGNNQALELAAAINEFANAGKQINIDIRIGEKTAAGTGKKFLTAFLIVKEMIPKDQQTTGTTTFTPKLTKAQEVKATAEDIKAEVEGS